MPSPRLRPAVRRRLSDLSRRSLERLEPHRTVVLTEFAVHPRAMWGWEGAPPNRWMEQILEATMPEVAVLASELCELEAWCRTIPLQRGSDRDAITWDNPMWGSVDAVMQVHALRSRRPATYLEVGSGFSTMFARKAIEDFDLPTRIVSVDPVPRAHIDELCDEVIRRPFEDVATTALATLRPGDVFVFDGSHLATMGSDAAVLFSGPLADVPDGVLLGIDDIFLPSDYHPTWHGRFYGEQYLVAAWLLGGHAGWSIRFPAWHATDPTRDEDLFAPLAPAIRTRADQRGTSLWMEKMSRSSSDP